MSNARIDLYDHVLPPACFAKKIRTIAPSQGTLACKRIVNIPM